MDKADFLNGKHTIFGKVVGNTIFNVLKMSDLETNENDVPLYPPKVLKTEVLWNPFTDIVPRNKIEQPKEIKDKKKKKPAVK
jgi:peptidyl-prolyl cis-trans isomerase SDCCAG10